MYNSPFTWILFITLLLGGRLEKPFLFLTLIGITWYGSKLDQSKLDPYRKTIAVLITTLTALDAITRAGRPEIFQPNLIACWMLLLPWSWWTPITLALTLSRGGILGYLAAKLAPTKFINYPLSIASIIILVLLAILRPFTITSRMEIYTSAIRYAMQSPLTGHGNQTFPALYRADHPGGEPVQTAHNAALTILVENGVVGFIAFLAWCYDLYTRARASQSPDRWNLLAFAIQQLVDDQWLHPITTPLLALVLASTFKPSNVPTFQRFPFPRATS